LGTTPALVPKSTDIERYRAVTGSGATVASQPKRPLAHADFAPRSQ